MSGNTFGTLFRLTTFGESHGPAVGGIIDGCPAQLAIDDSFIQSELNRRRPGQSKHSSTRNEGDEIEIKSGIFEGKSTGAPIAFIVRNRDQNPSDYESLKNLYRHGHADFSYQLKYGHRDYRGGGRASGRETVARVAGGAIAKLLLLENNIRIIAFTSGIGPVKMPSDQLVPTVEAIQNSIVKCPDVAISNLMISHLEKIKKQGDTAGGIVSCIVTNMPPGLGEPVFDKLEADLAKAILSIGGSKGFEYGSGFDAASMTGSEHNDLYVKTENRITTKTNHAGGISGGISNGSDIFFRVAFKPVSSINQEQETLNYNGDVISFKNEGRHDVCLVPRAVAVVEAMAALVIADHLLRSKSCQI